jgi:hypothetical protein
MNLTDTFAARRAASEERVNTAVAAFREYVRPHAKFVYAQRSNPNAVSNAKVTTAFRASCVLNGIRLSEVEEKRAITLAWHAIREDKFAV